MKILTITASDNSLGGASRVAMDLHHGILERGYDSFVFSGKSHGGEVNETVEEIKRPFWTKVVSYVLANDIDFFQTNYLLDTPQFKCADLVHCHNLHGWYFSLNTLRKMSMLKPVLWTLHDMWAVTAHGAHSSSQNIRNGIYKSSERNSYPYTLWNNDWYLSYRKNYLYKNMPINLVSPSKWLIEKLKKTCLFDKNIFHVPNGIDLSKFQMGSRHKLRKKYGFSNDPLILFVGADAENNIYKGFEDFIWLANLEASKNQFVCLGSSSSGTRANIQHLEKSNNKSYIAEILSCADVLVVTSRYENFPLVILEAMACGVSILTYDVGGCSEAVLDAPNCRVIKFGDKSALNQSLKEMLGSIWQNSDLLRRELRDYVQKKYNLDLMLDSYINIYKKLISNVRKH